MIHMNDSNRTVPLIKNIKLLMKDQNTVLTISFNFTCTMGKNCGACRLTTKQKENMKSPPICIFQRRVSFSDSLLMFPHSLDSLITDLNYVHTQPPHPDLETLFALTKNYCTDAAFTEEQFKLLVTQKLKMPFRLITSIENMENITTIPPKTDFTDKLANNAHRPITDEQYETFSNIWNSLNIPNLMALVFIYGNYQTYPLDHRSRRFAGSPVRRFCQSAGPPVHRSPSMISITYFVTNDEKIRFDTILTTGLVFLL